MNKLLTVSAALLAFGLSVPAKAADMPVKYVAPAPVFTWTGCYVGVHIGYKWGQSKQTYGGLMDGQFFPAPPPGTDLTDNYNVNGPVGGAQGGCNYQTGAWVWGVEVDGAWSSASGQGQLTTFAFLNGLQFASHLFTTNERWLSTARGRLGWAADRWMWYVTGGAAWSGFDLNNYDPVNNFQRQPTRVNKTGWIVGVGTEYALLGGWSVKSEFLYANFGTLHYGDESGLVNGCIAGRCVNADVKMSEYIWRVGMNYRFDWATFGKGKAPVVAKY